VSPSVLLLAACLSTPAWAGPLTGELLSPFRVRALAADAAGPLAAPSLAAPADGQQPRRGPHVWLGILGGGLAVPVLVGTGAAFSVAAPVKDPAERLFASAALGVLAGWVAGPVAVALLSDVRGILPRVVLGALVGAAVFLPAVFIPVVGWAVLAAGPALGALWAIETAPPVPPRNDLPPKPSLPGAPP
jgi:hypothetical protein